MGLINFKDINCQSTINKENKIINFNNCEIQVVNYLSAIDKYELIMATLQKSYENEVYNPIKLNVYFDLHLVYMYTNINFDVEDLTDEIALYDALKHSGLLAMVKEQINADELVELKDLLEDTLKVYKEYHFSIIGFLSTLLSELTDKIQDGLSMLQKVNPEELTSLFMEQPQLLETIKKMKAN